MRISLIGPPGSGKGTQAGPICSRLGIPHISTGDLIRAEIKAGTPMGQKIARDFDTGILSPPEDVVSLVEKRIADPDCANGFLLDGAPRTLQEVEVYWNRGLLDLVICLDVPKAILMDRMAGRRVDPLTKKTYHLTHHPPTDPAVLERLEIRAMDQNPEFRIQEYRLKTEPVIDFIAEMESEANSRLGLTSGIQILHRVDGAGNSANVTGRIFEILDKVGYYEPLEKTAWRWQPQGAGFKIQGPDNRYIRISSMKLSDSDVALLVEVLNDQQEEIRLLEQELNTLR